jgi:hypothetical protein
MHGSDYAGLSEVVCKCLLWRVKLVSRLKWTPELGPGIGEVKV